MRDFGPNNNNIFKKLPDLMYHLKGFFLFCLIFTLSFDVFLSLDIGLFTFRLANFFALLLFFIMISDRLLKGELKFTLKTPITIPALVFLFLSVVSLYQSFYLGKSIGYLFWYMFDLFVVYFGALNLLSGSPRLLKLGIKLHVICGAFIAAFGLFQLFGTALGIQGLILDKGQWILPGIPRISGFSYEPSYFAFFVLQIFAVGLVFWVRGTALFKSKILFPAIALMGLALFLSTSRTAWVGLFVLYLYALYTASAIKDIRKKRLLFIIGGTIVLVAAALLLMLYFLPAQYFSRLSFLFLAAFDLAEAASTAPRIATMVQAIQIFRAHPFLGVGIGGYGGYVVEALGFGGDPFRTVPANMWLEVLAETGIFGFLTLVWLVVSLWRALARAQRNITDRFWNAAIEAYKVSFLLIFFVAFQFAQTLYRMDVWFLLAMAVSVANNKLQENNEPI